MNVFEDTAWFDTFDMFVESWVLSRDYFDDYACYDCPNDFDGTMTEDMMLRIYLDRVRFKAGSKLSKGVN